MASIARDKNGTRRILFVAPDGKRPTIRLGKVSQRAAEAVKFRVEQLLAAKLTGHAVEADTARWVADLEPTMADKLARVGLINRLEPEPVVQLGEFLAEYVASRCDVKPASKLVWGHVQRNLTVFFGEDRDVRTITPGDADAFKLFLVGEKLAPTTIHKRLQFARTFFRAMLRRKLIAENPFADVKSPLAAVADRQRFVTREETARVLQACPDHHWRTIIALARYGGLRCPSEVLSLRWQDLDWETGRIVVQSPKTEHLPGKETRTIPLFPELREHLATSFELADDGAVYVVNERFRKAAITAGGWANANLRTRLTKIIHRAGLQPWPRLFQNLRASRETELVENYPVQVVTSWLGNTPGIAMKHYLMTTDEHFARAIEGDVECGAKAAQKAAQQTHAKGRMESQVETPAHEKAPVLLGSAVSCGTLQKPGMEDRGLEPLTFWLPARDKRDTLCVFFFALRRRCWKAPYPNLQGWRRVRFATRQGPPLRHLPPR